MEIKFLEPDIDNFSYLKIEYKEFLIETEVQIMGETALTAYDPKRLLDPFIRWWVGKGHLSLLLPAMIWGIIFSIDEKIDWKTLEKFDNRPIFYDGNFNMWLYEINARNERDPVWNEKIIQHIWMSLETYLPIIKRII